MALDAAFRILKYLEGPGYDDAGEVSPELHEEWDKEEESRLPEVSRLIGGLSDEDLEELQRRLALSPTTSHIFGSGGFQDSLRAPKGKGVGVSQGPTKYKSDTERYLPEEERSFGPRQQVGAPPQ